ncbi:helix-turn-helix transcriptional regulator [Oscillospiraceae bacterium 50-60]
MNFSKKLADLRRREGFSQEQLAERLGVTRQSVSKWESGAAQPELAKLVALSELFRVSVDYLVKDCLEEPDRPAGQSASTAKLEAQVEEISRLFRVWSWDSKTKIRGLPLVSIRLSGNQMRLRDAARGIIAIGNIAVGVLSLGIMSVGVVSIGVISAGLLALGCLAFGLAAFGPVALGLWCAGGVTALGGKIAIGVAAVGETAVGYNAVGSHVLLWGDGLTRAQAESFLLEHHPGLWRPLLQFLAVLGANIK